MGPDPMIGILINTEKFGHAQGEYHVTREAEIGVMQGGAKECPGLAVATGS